MSRPVVPVRRTARETPRVPGRQPPAAAPRSGDRGVTLAELVVVVALSSLVLLAAAAVVVPITVNAATVQKRAVASSETGVAARLARDLDRQVRSASSVEHLSPQQLGLCTYPSTEATTRALVVWTSNASTGDVRAHVKDTPITADRSYPASTASFSSVSAKDGAGALVRASLQAQPSSGTATTAVVLTRPRSTARSTCP